MMKRTLALLTVLLVTLVLPSGLLQATQTENNVLHIVPAPGPVKIDGKADDWDLSAGIFACDDVERLRDLYSVWFFAMYDKDNLYLMAKWKDATPLNNNQSSKGGHGFAGDCLQVRFITDYKTPDELVSHWMGWRDRDKINILSAVYGRDFKGKALDNAINQGAQQAFQIDADGKGYTQEIAIPWKLLTKNGQPLGPGDTMRMALEPNFTMEGLWGRLNIHDIFREGIVLDRVFTFRAYDQWGTGILESKGHLVTPPVRMSDAREFPVSSEVISREPGATPANAWPTVNWSGLIQAHELPGFKPITFTTPADGNVSLNIKDENGNVVRQLLTENFFEKGKHTVEWDGLTTPHYKTPGDPVPAGNYSWAGITHPPIKLSLRGWAHSGGSSPWENGGTTGWGGDHGDPSGVVTDGTRVYLGWSEAEAGKSLFASDLDGKVVWKVGTGLAGSSTDLALDGDILFSMGRVDRYPKGEIVRLRTADGVFDNWEGQTSAALDMPQLWADKSDKNSWPQTANGMDVKKGKLYLSFSNQTFYAGQISDWKGFVTKLMDGQPLDQRIYSLIDQRTTTQLKNFVNGKATEQQALLGNPGFETEAINTLNQLLDATDLAPGTGAMSSAARAEANRKFLETNFGPAISPLKTNFIAICDDHSGKLLKTVDVPYPQAVHAIGDAKIAFISDGSNLVTLNPETGESKTLVTGLHGATNFTTDADGKIYIGVAGADQQVKIFTPDGQPAGTIGRAGGRQLIGTWQPDGIYAPCGLAVDNVNKRLWVMEADKFPKRISLWNLADGTLVKDFFGATHYGASGGAIDPNDPNLMVGMGCEWKLDPATGHATCIGVFDRTLHGFAAFCHPANGRTYVAVNFEVIHGRSGTRIFERLSPGVYIKRAEWRPDYGAQTMTVWSDINGDGKEDPNEVTTLPYTIQVQGALAWSLNMNPTDFTLYGGISPVKSAGFMAATALHVPLQSVKVTQTVGEKIYRFHPAGFTACGAPKWDLEKPEDISYAYTPNLNGAGFGMLPSKDNHYLLTVEEADFRCYDLTTGKQIWSYPNTFNNVHGSHLAPPPIPGLFRGAYGAIGTFHTDKLGTVWVINGNCGEWYMLSERGYYLGHLFQSDVMKMHYPDQAIPGADMTEAPSGMGGEDFGGSLTQGADGQVYIEAGKIAFWNVLATGFDQVQPIGVGKIEVTSKDIPLAQKEQESQLQAAVGNKLIDFKHQTVTLTGDAARDFHGLDFTRFEKGTDALVRTAQAWDEQNLYLAWDVTDNTPWTNGATDPVQMYVSGDTVDFQFGENAKANPKRTDSVAGDFRLSIGNFQGKPTAVLYRAISTVKKPRAFTSGVIAHYPMDYVDVVPEANIKVMLRPDKTGYSVEAAIPWSALSFTPEVGIKYRGDMGVTYGNDAGSRTRLRVYLSNQETGLVDDAVFELKMTPRNWADAAFEK